MFSLTLKSLRANHARFVLTAIAVMLGVAFMVGAVFYGLAAALGLVVARMYEKAPVKDIERSSESAA